MAPPEKQNQQPLDLTSPAATKAAAEQGAADKAKEAPDLRQKTMDELRASAKGEVSRQSAELQATGKNIDEPTQRYLEQYFQSAINRFDKDKDGKINQGEAKEFQTAMMQKTKDIIGQVKQGAEAEKKIEAAAGKAEAMKPEEIGKNLEAIKDIGELSDLEQANTELQNLQTQNSAFQQGIQTQLSTVQKFGTEYNNFQQAQEGFGHFKEIYNAVVNSTESVAIAKMKGTLEATKTAVNAALTDLTAKKKTLDDNGEKIKAAIAKARQEAIKARDEKVAEIEKNNAEQKEKVSEKKQEYDRLGKARENMEKRQKAILDQQAKTDQLKKDWVSTKEKEQLDTREKTYKDSQLDIEAEIEGYRILLDSSDIPPEAKEKIKEQYEQAVKRQQQTGLGLQVIDAKRKSGAAFEQGLDEKQKAAGQELSTTDAHLKRQQETMSGLSQNIGTLEGLQLQYETSSEKAKEYFNQRIDLLDKHQESVDEFVLNGAMGRQQSLNALQQSANSLNGLTVESKGLAQFIFDAPGSLYKGIGGLLHSGAQWLDGNVSEILNTTRNSDAALDKGAYYVTQFLSVGSGFLSGALELGGGIFTLAGGFLSDIGSMPTAFVTWDSKKFHAFDTLKGLGAVIGYDGVKGEITFEKFKDTWFTVGKSLVGYGTNWGYSKDANGQEVWKDEYGTGLGKGIFNVLSMFVGVGEAKAPATGGIAAAKATSTFGKAGIMANAARTAALDAATAAGRGAIYKGIAGRGAQVWTFAKTLAAGLKPGFISKAATEVKLAPGIIGKGKAIAGSVAGSAAERVGATTGKIKSVINGPGKLGRAGEALLSGTKTTLKYSAKITAGIIAMPLKLTWNVLKAFRNTGSAFRNVARGLSNPRAVAAAEAASRIGNAASKIEAHGATAAKARVRLQEIIDGDPALSKKAAELESNTAKLTPEELATQKAELEQAAVKKLEQSDPALAEALQDNRQVSNYDQARAQLQEIIDGDPVLTKKSVELDNNAANLSAEQLAQRRLALESEAARKLAQSDPALAVAYQEVRRASEALQSESSAYIKATRKEADAVMNNPRIKAVHTEYTDLQKALEEAKNANNTGRVAELKEQLTAFEGNSAKMEQYRHFEEASAAKANLETYSTNMQDLRNSLFKSNSGEAVNLANEIAEARAAAAPAGSPEADLAITNDPAFAKEFTQQYEQALAAGDDAAITALESSLGTVHPGPLQEALEGLRLRQKPGFVATPVDNNAFAKALRENQDKTLSIYKEFEQQVQSGVMTKDKITEFVKDHQLPPSWQKGLEQMQQRYSFRNRMDVVSGELAMNRLSAEYRRVISRPSLRDRVLNRLRPEHRQVFAPGMTGAEAAEALSKRYATDTLQPAARGLVGPREVATNIRLKNGNFNMRVLDDGSVRLFNQFGDMLMTYSESSMIRAGLDIRPTVKAQDLANQIANRYKKQGANIGANESRLVAENIVLADGKKYSIKLSRDGSMKLLDADRKVVAPTNAAPAAAPVAPRVRPAPAAAPATTPIGSPAERMRHAIEAREKNYATFRSSREQIISIEERLVPMENRLNAMKIRKAPEVQIKSMEAKVKDLRGKREDFIQTADDAAREIWDNRKDYWKARVQEKGQAITNYIGMERRIAWVKEKSATLGKIAETGWKGLKLPVEYLRSALSKQTEYFSINAPKYFLLSRVGLEINQRMAALRAAAANHPEVPAILGELAMDQYRILNQLSGGREKLGLPPANEFAALSPEQQIAALGAAYNQLEGREDTGRDTFYTDAQKDYIRDKEVAVGTALDDLRNDLPVTAEKVQAAIDSALGPVGLNDAQKGYEISYEGIKIKVGKDGKRTVEGADRWAAEVPLKQAINSSLSENAAYYSQLTREQFKQDNPDQPVNSYEAFKKQVTGRVSTDISTRLGNTDVGAGLAVESVEKTKDGDAAFVATVTGAGVEVTPNEKWLREAYDNFRKSPDGPAKTPVAGGPRRPAGTETPGGDGESPANQESVETKSDEENIYS